MASIISQDYFNKMRNKTKTPKPTYSNYVDIELLERIADEEHEMILLQNKLEETIDNELKKIISQSQDLQLIVATYPNVMDYLRKRTFQQYQSQLVEKTFSK